MRVRVAGSRTSWSSVVSLAANTMTERLNTPVGASSSSSQLKTQTDISITCIHFAHRAESATSPAPTQTVLVPPALPFISLCVTRCLFFFVLLLKNDLLMMKYYMMQHDPGTRGAETPCLSLSSLLSADKAVTQQSVHHSVDKTLHLCCKANALLSQITHKYLNMV